jgi:hypothetical protein
MKLRPFRFALLALVLAPATYLRFPTRAAQEAPRIERFTTSSPAITSGDGVAVSWQLRGGRPAGVRLLATDRVAVDQIMADQPGVVTGESVRLEPDLSQVYTLVAQNRGGSDQQERFVAVQARTQGRVSGGGAASGGAAPEGREREADIPRGTFGVSLSPSGPFMSDAAGAIENLNDARVVQVAPGGEFYAEVSYRDPDGIAGIDLNLVNSSPEGLAGTLEPDQAPFSVEGAPSGTCELGRLPTAVRCLYRIRVADDARPIRALPGSGDEFAYVFRVRVSDGQGNTVNRPVRGYVAVTGGRER